MRTPQPFQPGDWLGRYEFLLRIARGGMAEVWAARVRGARGFTKMVAIKTMLPEFSQDKSFERMFLDEAELASRIHHPNVAEILDLGEEAKLLYLAMEWVDGEMLETVMKAAAPRGGVPLGIALEICAGACAGLHAAHELKGEDGRYIGLVHRDVSPPNLLVGYDGIVKVVDFGVAKAVEVSEHHTKTGQVKGKLRYMSPEQILGTAIDRRADVFAMGIVLYQLTTGHHPWRAETPLLTAQKVLEEPPQPARSHVADYPPELERVLSRALAPAPKDRFQTAAEMASALRDVALALGHRVSPEDVATYLDGMLGAHGRARREKLRQAMREAETRSQGKQRIAASSSGAVALASGATPRPGEPARRRERAAAGSRRGRRRRRSRVLRNARMAVSAVLFAAALYVTTRFLRTFDLGRAAGETDGGIAHASAVRNGSALSCPPDMRPTPAGSSCLDVSPVGVAEYDVCVAAGACSRAARGAGQAPELGEQRDREMADAYCHWVGKRAATKSERELRADAGGHAGADGAGFWCAK
jgi:hypothetical protein